MTTKHYLTGFLMAQYNNNVLGQSGTNFFFGVVEDNLDPLKIARVRVRCFGIHAADSTTLPIDNLPWASVMLPTNSNDLGISDLKNEPPSLASSLMVMKCRFHLSWVSFPD
jgi:hypothetical protein